MSSSASSSAIFATDSVIHSGPRHFESYSVIQVLGGDLYIRIILFNSHVNG